MCGDANGNQRQNVLLQISVEGHPISREVFLRIIAILMQLKWNKDLN